MRICIITKYLPPAKTDGIPRNRWEYANQFAALGHEVHIITSGKATIEDVTGNIYIHTIPDWDQDVYDRYCGHLNLMQHVKNLLCYSYLVYKRISELHKQTGLDIIDAPLWDLEGYVTKLLLPGIPMALRLESTPLLIREIRMGRTPEKDDHNYLETHFLKIADSYVFDSWSIFIETERLYQVDLSQKPSAMIYHGISLDKPKTLPTQVAKKKTCFKVVIIGRMEKRKGTDILIRDIFPQALQKLSDIEFHFAGFDNAEWDGFKEETGFFYNQYIDINYPEYVGSKIFVHGYVDDRTLDEMYESADAVLALSRYESFGLLYVEAMQKEKPLIVFNTGTVPEIFENGKDALVVPITQPLRVIEALQKLKESPELRIELTKNAKDKLHKRFNAERMGKECSAFFEEVVFGHSKQSVYQIMNALSDRDGVSNITLDYDAFLRNSGILTQILGTWATKPVAHVQKPIESVTFNRHDIVLYHYWNYCDKAEYFNSLKEPKKVFLFHNMTTPSFFNEGDEAFETTTKGFKQLKDLDGFDVYAGFSAYSVKILEQVIRKPIKTMVFPPLVDQDAIRQRAHSTELVPIIRSKSRFNILFVGRLANNKKQGDIIRFFDYYLKQVNSSAHLFLVGGGHDKFVQEVSGLINQLKLGNKITLTGKVPDEELYSYYRSADVYLSMSEHEGFGVPLTEAMAFNIPVVAFNCTSIPDTVGQNGCLFDKKDNIVVADILEKLRNDNSFRKLVLQKQQQQLTKFSPESVTKAFCELELLLQNQYTKRSAGLIESSTKSLIIAYDNPKIQCKGDWEYRKDGFLMIGGKQKSSLFISGNFESFELRLLTHKWGGKARIKVDDVYSEVIDLYSEQWKIETYLLRMEQEFGFHTLEIETLPEKHGRGEGFEVMLKEIKLLAHQKQPIIVEPYLQANKKEQKNISIPAIKKSKERLVRLQDVKKALDPIFHYQGNWQIKDEQLMFLEGNNTNCFIEFEIEFSELELGFLVHAWSGKVLITVDGIYSEVLNLYNTDQSIKYFKLAKTFEQCSHKVLITALNEKDKHSDGFEIFFKEILIHQFIPIQIDEEILARNYRISINVNTMNRAKHLINLLEALEQQTYPYFEVVIVNGPSTDETTEILEKFRGKIKIANCPDANLTRSRNIGISNSAGDFIAYIDDDAIPCDQYWLENYVYYLIWKNSQKIGAMGGPVKHRNTEFFEYRNGISSDYAEQVFDEAFLGARKVDGNKWFYRVCGCNNIMSKEALYAIGGFDERVYHYLDETDVCMRMWRKGYTIESHPLNFVRHYKGTNEFRKNDHDIRWDIIARSDVYFSLKNGHDTLPSRLYKTISIFSKKHFYIEIDNLYKNGKIDKATHKRYKKLMWKGFWEGIKWGLLQDTKKNFLNSQNLEFKKFQNTPDSTTSGITKNVRLNQKSYK